MIDASKERLITLAAAIELPELHFNGGPPHLSRLYRWAVDGVAGVRLETTKIGGSRCTSREAVRRFLDRLNQREPIGAAAS